MKKTLAIAASGVFLLAACEAPQQSAATAPAATAQITAPSPSAPSATAPAKETPTEKRKRIAKEGTNPNPPFYRDRSGIVAKACVDILNGGNGSALANSGFLRQKDGSYLATNGEGLTGEFFGTLQSISVSASTKNGMRSCFVKTKYAVEVQTRTLSKALLAAMPENTLIDARQVYSSGSADGGEIHLIKG